MSQKDFKNFIDISIFIQSSISIKIKKIACGTINFLYNCSYTVSLYFLDSLYRYKTKEIFDRHTDRISMEFSNFSLYG